MSGPAAGAVVQAIALRRLWWAAILLLGVSASAVVWTIWQLRADAIGAAVSETGNIASVLAVQLSRSLKSIDTVLLEIKQSAESHDIDSPADFQAAIDRPEFQGSLTKYLGRLPQVFNIAIADREGKITVSTVGWPATHFDVAGRDYFLKARDRRDGQLTTSIPAKNRISGEQTIGFSRRLEDSKGNFVGIVFASVNTKYFEDIYGAIQTVHSLLFTLLDPDGVILFRHPDGADAAGKELSNKAIWLDAVSKGDAGFRVFGQADGNIRYVSIRKVPEYPLIVDISVTEATTLAIWRQRAAAIGLGSAILLSFSIYLLRAMTRQVRLLSNSEASLAQKSRQLDAALNNMSQGVAMFDGRQRLIISNTQLAKIYCLTPEQTKPGTPFRAILEARAAVGSVPGDVRNFITDSLDQVSGVGLSHSHYELRDGRTVYVSLQAMDGGGWVSIHQDITAQKRIEAELERLACHDALTGLANRSLFAEKASAALAQMRRHGEAFSVLMLDLDRFKTVNDSFGHPVGDALLREIARRLLNTAREVDCVARFGGDEFAVLQAPCKDQKAGVIALADRILAAVTEPYDFNGRKLILETSIGIARAPQDGEDVDALIKHADLALYRAKTEGRNRYCFFTAAMEAEVRNRRELEDDMRKALSRHEFELHYQTIVNLESRQCCGAEALLRWRHPERGVVLPDQFIPIAEDSGLIVPLGEWILRQACADAGKWPSHFKVAVNLSPAQFKHGDLLSVLKSALDDTGLAPERLELEITETVLLQNNAENLDILREIKNLGVAIVLDDFGTGYSSMTYLQIFPFDRIKIDQTFVQNIMHHAADAAIVCAIAGLGRNLGIATVAEGVETEEQLIAVRAAGCQSAQGYLLSRPVPASELIFDRPRALRQDARAA
ncbi:MAG TPA: EAL domain-containing protein [Xanthobacteraceae bacterium]|nr:EAL domain-containing protein [Xanthobacteraceae bacterium]